MKSNQIRLINRIAMHPLIVVGRCKAEAFRALLNEEGARQVEDSKLPLGLVADFKSSLLGTPTFCPHEVGDIGAM